jgi:hypothetical protein
MTESQRRAGAFLENDMQVQMDSETGVLVGPGGRWTPRPDLPGNILKLATAMQAKGIDPANFILVVYDVLAGNPFHGAAVNLKFPAQMVVLESVLAGRRGYGCQHQLDQVLNSPEVLVTELLTAGVRPTLPIPSAPVVSTPPPPTMPSQPLNPIGAAILGQPGSFYSVPGDVFQHGSEYVQNGITYRKVLLAQFGMYSAWWERLNQ